MVDAESLNQLIEHIGMAAAALTTFTSCSVVLTGILFPSMMKSQFMRYIILISATEVLGSFLNIGGFPGQSQEGL